jgi:lipoate-protein ligase A
MQNLNFTFISNGEEGKLINFNRFVEPIISYLTTLGIRASIGKTHDIRIGDKKISGNAEHVYKKRVLHHGTLLFNSNLDQLRKAIQVVPGKYYDKAVQSNRSSVTNISEHLQKKISIEAFTQGLINFIANNEQFKLHQLTTKEVMDIDLLAKEKYKTIDWIWGYSPKYHFKNAFVFQSKHWQVELWIEKGLIKDSAININGQELQDPNFLTGIRHLYDDVLEKLKTRSELKNISNKDLDYLSNSFFS